MKKESNKREWENFVYNVAWLRKHYGISKKNMAKLLRIGVGTLTKIENGELPPRLSVKVIFNIHSCFGINPRDQLKQRLKD